MAIRWYSAERLTRLTGKLHTEDCWVDLTKLPKSRPSVGPMVITDIKQPFQSMMSGNMISSRRHYRDELRAYGCVEVGNDKVGGPATLHQAPDSKDIVEDIKRAIDQGPPPEMYPALREAEAAIEP